MVLFIHSKQSILCDKNILAQLFLFSPWGKSLEGVKIWLISYVQDCLDNVQIVS